MNRIDVLLNKYIDNELEPNELEEVQSLLSQEDVIQKLKGLQTVNNSLRNLEYETAPSGFTEKFMNRLKAAKSNVKISKNYFATTVNIIFILSIVVVLGIAFSSINWNFSDKGLNTRIDETIDTVKNSVPAMLSFFKNKSVIFFGSFLSIILLLGAFSSLEAHKSFKKKISSIS